MAKKTGRPIWFKMTINQKPLIDAIPDENVGRAMKAALEYFDTKQADLVSLEPLTLAAFLAIKPLIDESFADYELSCENGKKGGRPRKKTDEEENPPLPTLTQVEVEREVEGEGEKEREVIEVDREGERESFGTFSNVYLTEGEYDALASRYGESVAKGLIDSFSRKLKAKGYRYENHYATIVDWANKDGVKTKAETSYDIDDFFEAALRRAREEFEEG